MTSAMPSAIGDEYVTALQAYLYQGDEAALAQAYELGRRALMGGLGLLEVAEMHQHAVDALTAGSDAAEQPQLSLGAASFFRELLSPFEMALRGYREANAELTRANAALSEQRDTLASLNRELESFSYSVSHDLRAPLRSIDGFSRALLDECPNELSSEGARYLGRIREASQRMAHLIDDLLALSRITRTPLRRADVEMSAMAQRIADELRERAPERKARFVIEQGMRVRADPGLLAIILENLLGNAWKFTAKRDVAEIEVGRTQREGEVHYFVRDNGAGFDMRYASKLFGAFQRLHTRAEFDGTGIGLATVQRAVHRHRGHVSAEARVDAGATFFFTLGEGTEPS